MTMNIAHVLMYMFPGTDTPDNWSVAMREGEQQYISSWHLDAEQPTYEELATAYEEMQALPPTPEPLTIEERVTLLEKDVKELKDA
jgi:C1A family cysteine protease